MSISYSVYPEISAEAITRRDTSGYKGDNKDAVCVQESGNNGRGSVCRSCTFTCEHTTEAERVGVYTSLALRGVRFARLMGYLKGKSALMIYDKHPEQRSKWNKSFWARGYYVATIGTISEETIKKYIVEQMEKDKKEERYGAAL